MTNSKRFLGQTAETATFAFREYFRPVVAVARFLKSSLAPSKLAEATPEDQASLEDAKALLRERLAKGRRHEKMLLMQGILSTLASLLALAISLMHGLGVELAIVLAILLPVSTFAVWVTLRLVQNREEIVELKTLRWVMKSVDRETAERVMKQVFWGKPERRRRSGQDKNPH